MVAQNYTKVQSLSKCTFYFSKPQIEQMSKKLKWKNQQSYANYRNKCSVVKIITFLKGTFSTLKWEKMY